MSEDENKAKKKKRRKQTMMKDIQLHLKKHIDTIATLCYEEHEGALNLEENIPEGYSSRRFTKEIREKGRRKITYKKNAQRPKETSEATKELEGLIKEVLPEVEKFFKMGDIEHPKLIAADAADGYAHAKQGPGEYKIQTTQSVASAVYDIAYQFSLHVVSAKTGLKEDKEIVKAIAEAIAEKVYQSENLSEYRDERLDFKLAMKKASRLRKAYLSICKIFGFEADKDIKNLEVPKAYESSGPSSWAVATVYLAEHKNQKLGNKLYDLLMSSKKKNHTALGLEHHFKDYPVMKTFRKAR